MAGVMDTAGFGLSIFQTIQNELITREGNRSTLGLGFRLAIIEEKLKNHDAKGKNGLVWRHHHAIAPIAAVSPEGRALIEAQRKRLLQRKGAKPTKDDKDPTMLPRDDELWEVSLSRSLDQCCWVIGCSDSYNSMLTMYKVHRHYPRTVLEFKELQFHRMFLRNPKQEFVT